MFARETKVKYGIVISVFVAIAIAICGWFLLTNNASARPTYITAGQATDIQIANAADDTTTTDDTEDKGEVQKGDIIDYWLEATYVGFGDDKSGLVTFTDVLPEYMKLVTGTQTVQGKETDCTPSITNTSGVTWADPANPYSYDETSRTFTAQVTNIPASDGSNTGNVVRIHIYAQITDDAESLSVENVYYTNYVKITHAAATSISNKVQFHSGNPSDETYKVAYRFAADSPVPTGVTAPTDDSTYAKGTKITIQPNMEAQGYKFGGWKLVTDGLTANTYTWDEDNLEFTLNKKTDSVTTVTFEGTWTKNDTIDINYEWQGKESDLNSADSADDKPTASTPDATKADEGTPLKFPTYPATEDEQKDSSYKAANDSYADLYSQYNFLGWKVWFTYSDGTSAERVLTTAEKNAREFSPTDDSGKKVTSVKFVGYWVKKQFTVTFKAEDGQGPTNWTPPTSITSKWGKTFDVQAKVTVDGYRFNGWRTDPSLRAANSTDDKITYTMPANDVTVYASFLKTYSVTVTSGTASTSNETEATTIQAAEGEVVTLKPLSGMDDVRFNEWNTSVNSDANNWILQDDGTATFVMPANDVTAVGKYVMEIDFLVVNGTWSDGTTGYKMVNIDVVQQADSSWAGTMQSSQVPTGMKTDFSHKQDSGKWGDGTTSTQLPSTYVGTNKITASSAGKANHLTLFTYSFTDALDNITVTYKVNDDQTAFGTVKLNNDSDTAKPETSETFDPLGVKTTPVGATAAANAGYQFVNWTKDTDTDPYALDAKFVPFKIINTGGTTEFYEKATYVANFKQNTFTVKFNANKGTGSSDVTGSMDDQEMTYAAGTKLTKNTFKRTGYFFTGWNTSVDGTGTACADEADGSKLSTTDGATVTLYAQWQAQTVTVNYNGVKTGISTGGGVANSMTPSTFTYDNANQKLTANAFSLKGYHFTHWSESNTAGSSGIGAKAFDDSAAITNDWIATKCGTSQTTTVNLYTYWTANTYTVTFHANKGSGAEAVVPADDYTQNFTYDTAQDLIAVKYKRTGYVFKGWATSADSTTVAHIDQKNVSNLTDVNNGKFDLYAVWSVQKVTVKYNSYKDNYITGSKFTGLMTDQTVIYDNTSSQTLTMNKFGLAGYKFTHWANSTDKITTLYKADGATLTNAEIAQLCGTNETYELNLYTYWTPIKFTITFHANDSVGATKATVNTGYTSPYKQEYTYDARQNLTSLQYKRTGYVFEGWAESASSTTVAYSNNQQNVGNLTTTDGGNIDLYAIWSVQKLTVKFSGVTTGLNTSNYVDKSTDEKVFTYDAAEQKLTKNGFELLGYTFTHWSEANTAEGLKTKFKDDEGVITNAEIAAKCGTSETAEITLYTYWTPVTYTITFDKNEVTGKSPVTGNTSTMSVKYDETVTLNQNGYERVGYTFMGWDTDKNKNPNESTRYSDKQIVKNISEKTDATTGNVTVESNITLYAIWKVHTYTIQYYGNGNDSSTTMSAQSVDYDTSTNILSNGFRRYGYTFDSWNTAQNGSGTKYTEKQEVSNLIATSGGNFSLYAQWKANDYTVKFDLNDGTAGTDPEAKPSSYDDMTVQWASRGLTSGKTPTRPGYDFTKWQKKGTNTAVNINTTYSSLRENTSDSAYDDTNTIITLEAVWTEKSNVTINYKMDYSGVGNDTTVGSLDKTSESVAPATGTPTGAKATVKTGYRIKEWRIDGVAGDAGHVGEMRQNTFTPKKNTEHIYEAKTYVAVLENDIVDYKVKYYQEQADGNWNEITSDAKTFKKESNSAPAYNQASFATGGDLAKSYSGYAATPVLKYWTNDNKGSDDGGKVGTSDVQNVAPDGSLEIRAYYARTTHTVTFDNQGHGTKPADITGLRWGNKVTNPGDLVQAGWTFHGWYKEAACTNLWNFDTDLTTDADLTLYAKWTQNTYTVKYSVGNGCTNKSDFGDKSNVVWDMTSLVPTATPARVGYTFKNWVVNGDTQTSNPRVVSNDDAYSKLVGYMGGNDQTGSITLNAVWEKISKDNEQKTGDVTVRANNIRMSVAEATELLKSQGDTLRDKLIKLSDAFAEKDDETPVPITTLEHTIKAQAGQYTFTLGTAAGAKVTAKAYVYDGTATSGKAAIGAQNFRVSVAQVTSMNLNNATSGKSNLISLAHASAWNTETRADIGISTVTTGVQALEGEYDVTFMSNAVDGNTASVTVKCTVFSKGTSSATYRITANDFAVRKGTTLTDATIVSLGNAKAVRVDNGNEVGVTVDKGTLDTSKIGQYDITYKVTDEPATMVGAKVSVFDEITDANGEVIGANHFRISKTEVNNVDDSKLISLANAKAYEKATGKDVTVLVGDKSKLKAEKGTYPVTFKTAKGTSVTVNAVVVDSTADRNGITISANNFTVSAKEVTDNILKGGSTPDKDALISYAKAKATLDSDGSDVGIASVSSNPAIVAKKGTYRLTFTSNAVNSKTAETSVDMVVTDEETTQNGIRISANHFRVSAQEVTDNNLNDNTKGLASLIAYASASAELEADGTNVVVNKVDSKIEAKKGTYNVTFTATTADNKSASVTIKATVVDNSSTSGGDDDEDAVRIDANNFKVSVQEVKDYSLNDGSNANAFAKLKEYTNVSARKVKDGSSVEVASADSSAIKAEKGTYKVTFTSATVGTNTASVDVWATVVDSVKREDGGDGSTDTVNLFANNFTVSKSEVQSSILDANGNAKLDALIGYAHASAELASDGTEVNIESATTQIRAEKGTYDVTFKTATVNNKSAELTVTATVTDSGKEDSGETDDGKKTGVRATANDFTVSVKEVEAENLGDKDNALQALINRAHAKAEKVFDGSNVGIASATTAIEAKRGTYEVSFTSEPVDSKTATVSVLATVVDYSDSGEGNVDPDDPDGNKTKVNIYANDFSISVDEAKSIQNAQTSDRLSSLVMRAHASASLDKDGSAVDIVEVDSKELKAEKGTYSIKFTSDTVNGATAELSVKATVVDSATDAGGDGDDANKKGVRAYANNFTVSVDEVASVDINSGTDDEKAAAQKKLIDLAHAKAEKLLDASEVDIVSATSAIEAFKGEYEVIFKSAKVDDKEASVSVKATVTDYADRGDNTDPNPQPDRLSDVNIFANDFNLSVAEVNSIYGGGTNITSDVVKSLVKYAGARAEMQDDYSNVEITTVDTQLKAVRGVYDVKFATAERSGKSAYITVKATVTDEGTRGDDADIFANNFTVSIDEVKADKLGDAVEGFDSLVKRAFAQAYNKAGKSIKVASAETAIKPKLGKYNVIFTSEEVDGKSASVTVVATVKSKSTEDETNKERITANHFIMTVAEAADVVDGKLSVSEAVASLIKRANAEASSTIDGSPVEITNVDYSALKAAEANYPIIFSTAKGTSVSVFAKVSDNVTIVGNVAVYARDFDVSANDVTNRHLDDADEGREELIDLSEASAWDIQTFEPLDFSEITTAVEAKRGKYPVSFSATDGTDTATRTVKANVRDNKVDPSNPDPEPKPDPDPDNPDPSPDPDPDPDPDADIDIYIYGNNIEVSVDDVTKYSLDDGSASLDKLVELSEVIARKHSDGNIVPIVKATSSIKAAVGEYSVEFETDKVDDKSLSLEVKAKVYDNSSVTPDPSDPDNGIVMYGNNFSLSKAEADAISKGSVLNDNSVLKAFADGKELDDGQKELIRLASVVAHRASDGYELEITDVKFPYAGEAGDYTVTFESESGKITAKLDVVGTVTDEGTEDTKNKERIFANNIKYTWEEAGELLSMSNDDIATQLAKDANAHAVSTVDGSAVDVTDAEWNIQQAEGVYKVTFSTEKGTSVTVTATVGEPPADPLAAWLAHTGDSMFMMIGALLAVALLSIFAILLWRRRKASEDSN